MIPYEFKTVLGIAWENYLDLRCHMRNSLMKQAWEPIVQAAYTRYLCLAAQAVVDARHD